MKALIKVTTNEQGQKLVSGRELHEVLKVEKAFSTWIQTQLENVDAIENQDFCTSFKGNANLTQEEMSTPQNRGLFIESTYRASNNIPDRLKTSQNG